MTQQQICPTCSCAIGDTGYRKGVVTYCCEPCATGGTRECGCCHPVTESPQKKGTKKGKK